MLTFDVFFDSAVLNGELTEQGHRGFEFFCIFGGRHHIFPFRHQCLGQLADRSFELPNRIYRFSDSRTLQMFNADLQLSQSRQAMQDLE